MKIVKNIIKNEIYLLGFIVFQEILRILMKAGDNLAIDLKQSIIMFLTVAVLSVFQLIIKDAYNKNHDSVKR